MAFNCYLLNCLLETKEPQPDNPYFGGPSVLSTEDTPTYSLKTVIILKVNNS